MKLLLVNGSRSDATDADGRSAWELVERAVVARRNLIAALSSGFAKAEMLELAVRCDARARALTLLAHGARADDHRERRSGEGRAPLHVAVALGHAEMAQVLLTHDADPDARDGARVGVLSLIHI